MKNKKVVIALGAKYGGALTILKMYYQKALDDTENKYVFIVSENLIDRSHNIEVLVLESGIGFMARLKSFNAIQFSGFKSKLKEAKVIISLDNSIYGFKETHNIVYIHQALPFEFMFGKEYLNYIDTFKMFVLRCVILFSVLFSDQVIVQTYNFKNKIIDSFRFTGYDPSDKITVEYPIISRKITNKKNTSSRLKYIYPTNSMKYKNLEVLVDSFEKNSSLDINLKFYITLSGDENLWIKHLYDRCQDRNFPIEFIGKLEHEKVLEMYGLGYGLFFSSKVESFGLPLLEAINANVQILAYNSQTTAEILKKFQYENSYLFNDSEELLNIMYDLSSKY